MWCPRYFFVEQLRSSFTGPGWRSQTDYPDDLDQTSGPSTWLRDSNATPASSETDPVCGKSKSHMTVSMKKFGEQ